MLGMFENKAIEAPENKTDLETLRVRLQALRRNEAAVETKLNTARARSRQANAKVTESEDEFILEKISAEDLGRIRKEAVAAGENVQELERQLESHRGLLRRSAELLHDYEQEERRTLGAELLAKHREIRKRHAAALVAVVGTNSELEILEAEMKTRCPRAMDELVHAIPKTAGQHHRIHAIFELSLTEGQSVAKRWLEALRAVAPGDLPAEAVELLEDCDRAEAAARAYRHDKTARNNASADSAREQMLRARVAAVYAA